MTRYKTPARPKTLLRPKQNCSRSENSTSTLKIIYFYYRGSGVQGELRVAELKVAVQTFSLPPPRSMSQRPHTSTHSRRREAARFSREDPWFLANQLL